MTFLSYPFLWLFLPLGLAVYWLVPRRARVLVLLALNAVFYLYHSCWQGWLLLASILITYAGARFIEAHRDTPAARRVLALTLVLNLSLLLAFKLQPLAASAVNTLAERRGAAVPALAPMALPLGLSFFIFSGTGYVLDVYWKSLPAQKDFLRHAAFISFFPTISAGPILRGGVWFEQLESGRRLTWSRLKKAFLLFLWGAFLKMVIADRIALYVNAIYQAPQQFHGYYLLLALFLYPLQIYADFAGYSMMALGVACAFGFDLPDNFRQPYLACGINEFWDRWHISLTSWLNSYVFNPLALKLRRAVAKWPRERRRRYKQLPVCTAVLVTFLISGLWHGMSSGYVVWGLLNGFYCISESCTTRLRSKACEGLGIRRESIDWKITSGLFTFSLVAFSLVFFRAGTLAKAGAVLLGLLRLDNAWILFDGTLEGFGIGGLEGTVLLLALLVLLLVSVLQRHGIDFAWFEQRWSVFQGLVLLGLLFAVMVYGIYGPDYDVAGFIYAGF